MVPNYEFTASSVGLDKSGGELPWSENTGIAAASCGVWGGKSLGWDNTGSCRRGKMGQVGNPRV